MKAWYEQRPAWERANKKGHIRLVRDFCFWVDSVPYWIPGDDRGTGYVCNGASIPGVLSPVLGSWSDPMNDFCWPHDAGYLSHAFTRAQTDEIAYQFALQAGNGEAKAHAVYAGVRSFADLPLVSAWNNNAQDLRDLQETRTMIINRPDCDKFQTMWFPNMA